VLGVVDGRIAISIANSDSPVSGRKGLSMSGTGREAHTYPTDSRCGGKLFVGVSNVSVAQ